MYRRGPGFGEYDSLAQAMEAQGNEGEENKGKDKGKARAGTAAKVVAAGALLLGGAQDLLAQTQRPKGAGVGHGEISRVSHQESPEVVTSAQVKVVNGGRLESIIEEMLEKYISNPQHNIANKNVTLEFGSVNTTQPRESNVDQRVRAEAGQAVDRASAPVSNVGGGGILGGLIRAGIEAGRGQVRKKVEQSAAKAAGLPRGEIKVEYVFTAGRQREKMEKNVAHLGFAFNTVKNVYEVDTIDGQHLKQSHKLAYHGFEDNVKLLVVELSLENPSSRLVQQLPKENLSGFSRKASDNESGRDLQKDVPRLTRNTSIEESNPNIIPVNKRPRN